MKKIIIGFMAISSLLAGCGSRAAGVDLATKPPWVSSYIVGKPTVYYVSTGEKVQSVGKLVVSFNPKIISQGQGGWSSNDTDVNPIKVYAIPGIDLTKAIAVKFAKDGPFIKAVAQSKHP